METITKEELRELREKHDELMKDYVPPPQIPESDKYEHEMIRPETKEMRARRQVFNVVWIIVWIALTMPFLYMFILFPKHPSPISLKSIISKIVVLSLIVLWWRWAVISQLGYDLKIRLTITEKELIIRSPWHDPYGGPSPLEIEIPIHEIVDASIRNSWSPELKCIMHEDRRFKYQSNRNLHPIPLLHRSPYKYLLSVNAQPFSVNTNDHDFIITAMNENH